MKRFYFLVVCIWLNVSAWGQTPQDGLMMSSRKLCTGFMYTHSEWRNYWEGTLKRDNGNIGSVTTQSVMWYGVYGISSRWNVMASVPYIWTKASRGTLTGMEDLQDLMVAAKYRLVQSNAGGGTVKAFLVGAVTTPLTDYSPDFLPLSIGLQSTTIGGRFTLNYTYSKWYVNGSAGYAWRENVTLDRDAYFTDGRHFSTNEVQMPNLFDFNVNAGYNANGLQAEVFFAQQNTLGGGDIRRHDMPFVSNRMNAQRIGALVAWFLPRWQNVSVRVSGNYVVQGRNMGEATSFLAGVLYTFNFNKGDE